MYTGMQVAAYADTHILVRKHDSDGRAETAFQVLDDASSRVSEVADMLGLDAAVAERLLQEARDDVAASATAAASAHSAVHGTSNDEVATGVAACAPAVVDEVASSAALEDTAGYAVQPEQGTRVEAAAMTTAHVGTARRDSPSVGVRDSSDHARTADNALAANDAAPASQLRPGSIGQAISAPGPAQRDAAVAAVGQQSTDAALQQSMDSGLDTAEQSEVGRLDVHGAPHEGSAQAEDVVAAGKPDATPRVAFDAAEPEDTQSGTELTQKRGFEVSSIDVEQAVRASRRALAPQDRLVSHRVR